MDPTAHPALAPVAIVSCGASIVFGLTIGEINQYLQAGAFIVAMISGTAATAYYTSQAIINWRRRHK